MSHHYVDVRDLHYTYPDGTHALEGVNFRITHGESVALVGANGAGKSTLLRHLVGAILPPPEAVCIGDFFVTKENLSLIRQRVGMVFPDPDDQLFMPTVGEDVAFGPLNLGWPAAEVEAKVAEALEAVGAADLADRAPHRLSSGEKRRAALATVLAMSPDILILDEPAASLDPRTRRKLIDLLQGFEHTKIITTHDLDLALELCPRAILLGSGRVVADGDTREIFADAALLESHGLEQPTRLRPCPICGSVAG